MNRHFVAVVLFSILGWMGEAHASAPDSLLRAADLRSAMLYGGGSPVAGNGSGWQSSSVGRRSVPFALGLSAVLPGAGQAYNHNWIKSAVALAVEGALLAGYVSWHSRGLDEEQAYQDYAHAYWDPRKYAGWLNDYVVYLNDQYSAGLDVGPIAIPEGVDFSSPDSWTSQQSAAVRQFFNEIRGVETHLFHPETHASFSHKLPYFGEQQYYELIGKYFQFSTGWEDYPDWTAGDEFTQAIDPEKTGPDGKKINVQGRFYDYARNHAHANTLLRNASRVTSFVVLNHIVAAIDAAISAKLHNDRLDADVKLGMDVMNEPQLFATVRWSF